jgi:hypothetical protein
LSYRERKQFKSILYAIVAFIFLFTILGFVSMLLGIDAENFWRLDTLVLGFFGGLITGKTVTV